MVRLADGKERSIRYIASTTYWSHDGKPITAQEFMDQLFGDIGTLVASEDELRTIWSDPDRRLAFIQRLVELGYDADRIEDMRRLIDWGLVDVFRERYDEGGLFSWWDYRAGNFHKRKGMRIDLVLATEPLAERLDLVLIDRNARKGETPSDHAPVIVDFTE